MQPSTPSSTIHDFQVQGMTCGHCERGVTQAIQGVDPDATVHIDRAAGQVRVAGSSASRDALAAAIAEEGYRVAP